jgi:hypothetical protein
MYSRIHAKILTTSLSQVDGLRMLIGNKGRGNVLYAVGEGDIVERSGVVV